MLDKTAAEHLRHYIDAEVSVLISESRGIEPMDGLRLFLPSETYKMLCDPELNMWEFSPIAIFDMWENEIKTGDPRNSLYLRG
jgi:hypothetical protein